LHFSLPAASEATVAMLRGRFVLQTLSFVQAISLHYHDLSFC